MSRIQENVVGDVVGSNLFTILPGMKVFCCDASDLKAVGVSPFRQLWNDSCDQGLVIMSSKTGNRQPAYLHNIQTDNDGDVVCWELRFLSDALKGWSVRIFNT